MVRGQANDGGRVIVGDEGTEIPTLSMECRHFVAYALHSSDNLSKKYTCHEPNVWGTLQYLDAKI